MKKSGIALWTLVAIVVIGLLFAGIVIWRLTDNERVLLPESGENLLNKSIEIETEGLTMHYQENCFWSESYFELLLDDKADFKSKKIEEFKDEYNVVADDFKVSFDESRRSTVLEVDVHEKVSKGGASYTATLLWFLGSVGLDFIDDNFSETNTSLFWSGVVDGVPTSVFIDLPSQDSVYGAWEESVGHCHGHVWWPV